jgi:hypothetical protein
MWPVQVGLVWLKENASPQQQDLKDSKALNIITIPPTRIQYIGNIKGFTQLKKKIVERPM